MTFDPKLAFIECPKCDSAFHVEQIKGAQWFCNCCAHEFEGPRAGAGNTSGYAARRDANRTRSREDVGALIAIAVLVAAFLSVLACPPVFAQTDPRTLPMWDGTGITYAGTFNVPQVDANGVMLDYGGNGAAVSEDGKFLYVGCFKTPNEPNQSGRGLYAKLEIPAIGQMARIVEPCRGLSYATLAKIHPDPNAYHPSSAGIVEIGGKVIVSGYITYDANGGTTRSHWSGASLSTLAGPFSGTVSPGLVKGQMGVIPQEWRALLGGDVYATAGYTSIISRASLGAAFTVFNSADVTRDGFAMTMLQGCLHSVPLCQTWGSPQSIEVYNGSEQSGGSFFVPGTRTLVAMEREALGPTCYGYATRNQAEHGQKYLDAVKCYSLSDALDQKGPMGYPYQHVWKLYDLTGLVDVKQGRKQAWENNKPAKVVPLPNNAPNDALGYYGGAAFNPVRGEFYLVRELHGAIRVYTGFPKAGSPPPPPPPPPNPVDCVGTWGAWSRVANSESACSAEGSRTFSESRLFTVVTPASNGGTACPASPETRTATEPCTPPVSQVTYTCWVTSSPSSYADGDARRQIRCDTNGPTVSLPNGTTFTVTVPRK